MYGRSGGRPLSRRQQELADTLLPKIAVPAVPAGALDPRSLFGGPVDRIWLEIGFGGGEHLCGQAVRHAGDGFLGAEPFLEGVGKCLSTMVEEALDNVRIWRGDGRVLVDQLVDRSVDRLVILFPDPWPKTRHRKRRLLQATFLEAAARVLKPGAPVRFATDWADYAERALETFLADGRFVWTARRADDWRLPPADHVTTRYQDKRLGDCAPVFLDFEFAPSGAG
jgi:tRNA (guanine-N7-)-methyltransferase